MAVYTSLTPDQIAEFLRDAYGLGPLLAAEGIAEGVENTNYKILTSSASGAATSSILTLYEKRVNPEELPFFLGLMQHLAARGVACPLPLPRTDGALMGPLAGKIAAMVTFLSGQSRATHTPAHTRAAGVALAQLHAAGEGFDLTRTNDFSLAGWRDLAARLAGTLDAIAQGLEAEITEHLAEIHTQWAAVAALPQGIIHADYFPDNVFFTGEAVSGVIDFYFACRDALAYDLAIAINAWCCAPDGTLDRTQSAAMIAGYQSIRPLTETEIGAFPLLMRGAALRFLLTRAYDWVHRDPTALVTVKSPLEYLAKLRIHATLTAAQSYGDFA